MGDKLFGVEWYFGSLITLTLFVFWASQCQNWRKRTSTARMVFRQSPVFRFVFGGIGLWLVLTPPLLMVRDIKDATGWLLFSIFEIMSCAMGGLFLWGAGLRREMSLNVERGTYQFTKGWGPWTRVRSGGLEDFTGVFVRCTAGRDTEMYTVGLVWKNSGPVMPTLGIFRGRTQGRQKADVLVAEMMNAFRLPLVAAPPPETIRDLFRRGSRV
jgi:hypothetical protein